MNPATTVGRHPLSTRFTANVRVCVLDYPDTQELTAVYAELLDVVFRDAITAGAAATASNLAAFGKPAERTRLAATLVENPRG